MNELEDIEKALRDYGYSKKAIEEISKWYQLLEEENHSVRTRPKLWNIGRSNHHTDYEHSGRKIALL